MVQIFVNFEDLKASLKMLIFIIHVILEERKYFFNELHDRVLSFFRHSNSVIQSITKLALLVLQWLVWLC